MLELDARILHGFEDGDAHIAAGEVVVGAVHRRLGIPHEVHADEAGDKDELGDAAPEQRLAVDESVSVKAELGHVRNAVGAEHRGRNYRKHESDERAKEARSDVQLIHRAAELVVDGPVPRRVGVTVEEDARLHFAVHFLMAVTLCPVSSGKRKSNVFLYSTNWQIMIRNPTAMSATPSAGRKKKHNMPRSAHVMV